MGIKVKQRASNAVPLIVLNFIFDIGDKVIEGKQARTVFSADAQWDELMKPENLQTYLDEKYKVAVERDGKKASVGAADRLASARKRLVGPGAHLIHHLGLENLRWFQFRVWRNYYYRGNELKIAQRPDDGFLLRRQAMDERDKMPDHMDEGWSSVDTDDVLCTIWGHGLGYDAAIADLEL